MKRMRIAAVKEALDNLPTGICFFDRRGIPVLCNLQMQRLIFSLTAKDLQSISDVLPLVSQTVGDGERAWRFSAESITARGGRVYTQVTAFDVTTLYAKQRELERDKKALEDYAERMRRLSADIISLIRDEETLNMKVRVHGDIGRSVIATRRLIQEGRPTAELDMSVWKDAVKLLRHDIEISDSGDSDADADGELSRAAQSMGIHIKISGEYPAERDAQALLRSAVRECMTNAVRHAAATELYVCLESSEGAASVTVTNNGVPPAADIKEGGGLSSLRARVEKVGGTMTVCAAPHFELRVTVPLKR